MGVLRNKLLRYGLQNVSYLIVNQQDISSRRQYQELKRRAPKEIPVYQQAPRQQNVWKLLNGAKDDFLIYDRCGRLTFHIVLPYTFLQYPYVEAAIWVSYRKDICGNCSVSDAIEEGDTEEPLKKGWAAEVPEGQHHHPHSHGKRLQKQHLPHHHNDRHHTQGGH
uniref:Selenoprotein P N-terminal domain-containing protein n=1 Tax=Scleropages formosus TaxID=113540 RepID=A0A8C9SF11_SCLFO